MATERREAKKAREQRARAARLTAQRRRYRRKAIAMLGVFALLLAGVGGLLGTVGGNGGADSASSTTTTTENTIPPVPAGKTISGATPCPPADGSAERASTFEKAPPNCIDAKKAYTAEFDTTEGKIVVALDTKKTPGTTNNFVVLSRYHYFDGSAIVRTNKSIDIIQGGAPTTQTNADPGPGYTINDEGAPFTYKDGDLVMANTGQPNSSGGQWFFGAGPNVAGLDQQGSYLNFGHTTEGLDVLHKILALHADTGDQSGEGKPSKTVIVNKVTIKES